MITTCGNYKGSKDKKCTVQHWQHMKSHGIITNEHTINIIIDKSLTNYLIPTAKKEEKKVNKGQEKHKQTIIKSTLY